MRLGIDRWVEMVYLSHVLLARFGRESDGSFKDYGKYCLFRPLESTSTT